METKPAQHKSKSFHKLSLEFLRNSASLIQRNFEIGDFYRLRLPATPFYVCTDPEIFEFILVC